MRFESRAVVAQSRSQWRFGRWLPELGGGVAPTHDFRWGGALDEEDLETNSPRLSWVLRGRRLGLAVVGGSPI
jgi:hypothetical protein